MRRFLVILLCLMLVITACGTKEKIPEGMSKEFYHAMLEMDKEIQKSLETKIELRPSKENGKYKKIYRKYILPVIKNELPQELVEEMRKNGYDLDQDKNMTEKEKITSKALADTTLILNVYLRWFNKDKDSNLTLQSQQDFENQYKKFKELLELQ